MKCITLGLIGNINPAEDIRYIRMSVESTNWSGRAWKKIPEVPAEEHPPLVARAATKTPLDPFLEGIRKSNSTEMSVLAV